MSDCIETATGRSSTGYGLSHVNVGGRAYAVRVHRFVYEQAHGPIPIGLVVCHACDNRACINIDHLFLGTVSDNAVDSVSKGRHVHTRMTHCYRGHEFSPENTWMSGNRRICKACRRIYLGSTSKGATVPRKSNDEMIAELEAKLAKARETAVSRRQTEIDKLKERKAALLERKAKIESQVKAIDLDIAGLESVATKDEDSNVQSIAS